MAQIEEKVMVELARSEWVYSTKGKFDYAKRRGTYSQALARLLEKSISPRVMIVPSSLQVSFEDKVPAIGATSDEERMFCCVIYGS